MDWYEPRYADYALSPEHEALQDAFGNFFLKECPSDRVRQAEPLGFDEQLWIALLHMGGVSMALPVQAGGDGGTISDLVIVAEQLGAALAPLPFVEHVTAIRALASASPERVGDASELITAIALEPIDLMPRQLVPGGAVARRVVALDDDALVLVNRDVPPPLVRNHGSTPLAWWAFCDQHSVQVLMQGPEAVAIHQRARAEWQIMMAAALVGLTRRALDVALDFVRTRYTLGVPLGSLQGVAFPLVDVDIAVRGARNLTRRAAWMLEHDPEDRRELPALAFAYAAQTATEGATTAVHAQGGLGFTTEADASLSFLRAKGWSDLGGDPVRHLVGVGRQLVEDAVVSHDGSGSR